MSSGIMQNNNNNFKKRRNIRLLSTIFLLRIYFCGNQKIFTCYLGSSKKKTSVSNSLPQNRKFYFKSIAL
jgi:hypothetical protein